MKYLFFDIECADGYRAICEFGYVLTDDKFKIINKRNILMDPECRFKLRGRKGQVDLELTYPYDEYYKYYSLKDSYDFIKKLLTQEDVLIFGHSVYNDILFLLKDCDRYKLDLIDFTAYDVQRILRDFNKQFKFTSLDHAYKTLIPESVRNSLLDHRALDDAYKTLLVFKAMTEQLEVSPSDLVELCPKAEYNSIQSFESNKEKKKGKKLAQALEDNGKLWKSLIDECEQIEHTEEVKKVTLTRTLKENTKFVKEVINYIKESSFIACKRFDEADYIVALNEENINDIKTNITFPFKGKLITYSEFLNLIK